MIELVASNVGRDASRKGHLRSVMHNMTSGEGRSGREQLEWLQKRAVPRGNALPGANKTLNKMYRAVQADVEHQDDERRYDRIIERSRSVSLPDFIRVQQVGACSSRLSPMGPLPMLSNIQEHNNQDRNNQVHNNQIHNNQQYSHEHIASGGFSGGGPSNSGPSNSGPSRSYGSFTRALLETRGALVSSIPFATPFMERQRNSSLSSPIRLNAMEWAGDGHFARTISERQIQGFIAPSPQIRRPFSTDMFDPISGPSLDYQVRPRAESLPFNPSMSNHPQDLPRASRDLFQRP